MGRQSFLPYCYVCLEIFATLIVGNGVGGLHDIAKDMIPSRQADESRQYFLADDGSPRYTDGSQTNAEKLSVNGKLSLLSRPEQTGLKRRSKRRAREQSSPRDMIRNIGQSPLVSCSNVMVYNEFTWLIQVTKCPSRWTNATIRESCELWDRMRGKTYFDDVTILPVQDDVGVVYANVYCAMCNHVQPVNMNQWETRFKCENLTVTDDASLIPENLDTACHRSVSPWKRDAIVDCKPVGVDISYYFREAGASTLWDSGSFPVSFNFLMNFDLTGNTHLIFTAKLQIIQSDTAENGCQAHETYDTYRERCRPITCSSFHHLEDGHCVAEDSSAHSTAWAAESTDELLLVEGAVVVSLIVDISLGGYVLGFMNKPDANLGQVVAMQLAEDLDIASNRMSHFNISFVFGSSNGSAVQVRKVTDEEYKQLTSDGDNINVIGDNVAGVFGRSDPGVLQDDAVEPDYKDLANRKTNFLNHSGRQVKKTRAYDRNSQPTASPVYFPQKSKLTPNWTEKTETSDHIEYSQSLDPTNSEHALKMKANKDIRLSPRSANHKRMGQGYYVAKLLPNKNSNATDKKPTQIPSFEKKTTSESKQEDEIFGSWQKVKYSDKINDLFIRVDTDLTDRSAIPVKVLRDSKNILSFNTGEAMERQDGRDYEVYLSSPINEINDHYIMRSSASDAIDNPMVMEISFLLEASWNPNEENSKVVADRITNLVVDRELHLEFSGKALEVVNSTKVSHADEEAFCRWGKKYKVKDDEFSFVKKNNMSFVYENKTGTYKPVGEFNLWYFVKVNNFTGNMKFPSSEKWASLCHMPEIKQKDCRRIELTPDEYWIIERNKSLIFQEREYDIDSYEVLNETTGSMAICVPQGYDMYEHHSVVDVEDGCGSEFVDVMRADGFLSLILGRISSAALCLVLITYCLFKKLRNLPGCNTMNLTLALLVAQIVFTEGISASPPWLCSVVAVTEHLTRLAAQFWMSVISFDIYQTFSKPAMPRSTHFSENRKRFFKYSLYGWGVPCLIVGICALIDFSDLFTDAYIGYGGRNGVSRMAQTPRSTNDLPDGVRVNQSHGGFQNESVPSWNLSNDTATTPNLPYMGSTCWITNSLASLLAFGAPIFLIVIVNCAFFIRTIMIISKTTKLSKQSLSQRLSDTSLKNVTAKADVMLYIRMSTVMGLTWIFGFIWSMISSFATVHTKTVCIVALANGILSTIFNVSQGIFIFIAFVCNRRVFTLYMKLCTRTRKRLSAKVPKNRLHSDSSTASLSSVVTQSSQIVKY